MKENHNIDQLLNAFIDDELAPRQITEVHRLLANNPNIAERLKELQKCKILVSSLPAAKAPPEMLENIKASLERKTLLTQQSCDFSGRRGQRELMFRKLITAAAMIGLVAILATVIYTIVKPQPKPQRMLTVETSQPPAEIIPAPKTNLKAPVEQKQQIAKAPLIENLFIGRLELKTHYPVDAEEIIVNAAKQNNLFDNFTSVEADENVFILKCSKKALASFLVDLNSLWVDIDSARLFVDCPQTSQTAAVDSVTAQQIVDIANQETDKKRVEIAKAFSFLNSLSVTSTEKSPPATLDRDYSDILVLLNTIPKPILTSPAETGKKYIGRTDTRQEVTLAIVLLDISDEN